MAQRLPLEVTVARHPSLLLDTCILIGELKDAHMIVRRIPRDQRRIPLVAARDHSRPPNGEGEANGNGHGDAQRRNAAAAVWSLRGPQVSMRHWERWVRNRPVRSRK